MPRPALSRYAEGSTIHGVNEICLNRSVFTKVFWSITMAISLSTMVYMMMNIIDLYRSNPVATKVETRPLQRFPDVAVCPPQWIDFRKVQSDNITMGTYLASLMVLKTPPEDIIKFTKFIEKKDLKEAYELSKKFKTYTTFLKHYAFKADGFISASCSGCGKSNADVKPEIFKRVHSSGVCYIVKLIENLNLKENRQRANAQMRISLKNPMKVWSGVDDAMKTLASEWMGGITGMSPEKIIEYWDWYMEPEDMEDMSMEDFEDMSMEDMEDTSMEDMEDMSLKDMNDEKSLESTTSSKESDTFMGMDLDGVNSLLAMAGLDSVASLSEAQDVIDANGIDLNSPMISSMISAMGGGDYDDDYGEDYEDYGVGEDYKESKDKGKTKRNSNKNSSQNGQNKTKKQDSASDVVMSTLLDRLVNTKKAVDDVTASRRKRRQSDYNDDEEDDYSYDFDPEDWADMEEYADIAYDEPKFISLLFGNDAMTFDAQADVKLSLSEENRDYIVLLRIVRRELLENERCISKEDFHKQGNATLPCQETCLNEWIKKCNTDCKFYTGEKGDKDGTSMPYCFGNVSTAWEWMEQVDRPCFKNLTRRCRNLNCYRPCHYFYYEPSIVPVAAKDKVAMDITVKPMHAEDVTTLVEVPTYTWDTFISNIGGFLGLFCGASLVSVVQLIYFFVLGCCIDKEEKEAENRKRNRQKNYI